MNEKKISFKINITAIYAGSNQETILEYKRKFAFSFSPILNCFTFLFFARLQWKHVNKLTNLNENKPIKLVASRWKFPLSLLLSSLPSNLFSEQIRKNLSLWFWFLSFEFHRYQLSLGSVEHFPCLIFICIYYTVNSINDAPNEHQTEPMRTKVEHVLHWPFNSLNWAPASVRNHIPMLNHLEDSSNMAFVFILTHSNLSIEMLFVEQKFSTHFW